MKWYIALNEAGTRGDIGLHTKLAVLSARKKTTLQPTLLYFGDKNDFTDWLEAQGVDVVPSHLPYLSTITDLVKEKKYTDATVGHWLRTNVCLTEMEDERVFYTDVDVLFLKQPLLETLQPRYFMAAPEFDRNNWNYFNAGVMLARVPGLREEYQEFEKYIKTNIKQKTYSFHDQIAYNQFYRGRWERLPIELNWKPYWGSNPESALLHFHGPKIGAIEAIVDERWNWSSDHGQQIGSLFIGFFDSYLKSFEHILEYTSELSPRESEYLHDLAEKLAKYDVDRHKDEINLNLLQFRMFPDGE